MNRVVSVACVAVLGLLAGCSERPLAIAHAEPPPVVEQPVPAMAFEADFTGQPDGPPADQRLVLYDNSRDRDEYGASLRGMLTVAGGALVSQATEGLAAGYAQVDIGRPVTRIGAEFTFTPGERGGALSLPVWAEPFQQTWPRKPNSPSHLILAADYWGYGVYDNNTLVGIHEGRFDPPLPTGTLLRLDIFLSGDTATVYLPDGTAMALTDPRIAGPAQFATFESYQMDAATMGRVRFARVWAD